MKRPALLVVLAACGGPAVGEVRTGLPHTSRPADCQLQLVTVSAADMAPGARFGSNGEYEMVGSVLIGADKGTDAFSDEVKKIVRPRACKMGGEIVSLLASGTDANLYGHAQQSIAYTVWAKRSSAPSGPQTF
jgi:hypothetical protein